MRNREQGWYWIKEREDCAWECSAWDGEAWFGSLQGDEPEIIGPRAPSPDEPFDLAPREPTERMLSAAACMSHDGIDSGGSGNEYRKRIARREYQAMLDAAPSHDGDSAAAVKRLTDERDRCIAKFETFARASMAVVDAQNAKERAEAIEAWQFALAEQPALALSRLKAEWQSEVLEQDE